MVNFPKTYLETSIYFSLIITGGTNKLTGNWTFFEKVILLDVKEFHGLHDDLKIISKTFNPWPLS